jgi:serine/threonine-protein kinase
MLLSAMVGLPVNATPVGRMPFLILRGASVALLGPRHFSPAADVCPVKGIVVLACPSCATPVEASARTCPSCGSGLDIAESPTGTAPRPREAPSPTSSPERARTPTPGAPGRPGERFVPGTVLAGRYRIVGLLGRGGMGEVYRADDLKLEQPVALKFLPHGLDADEGRLARFYREVRVARQVSHPAVCRVYDVAEADGHLFLSMEMVDGENLASLLRRIGRLPADKATDIARQLCAGLAAAHEKGVLHRDLKPSNLMLDGQGNVRITDFGLAGLAETLGEEDARSGTPSYMSPEQLQGRDVTVRSDIYALGLVLYELYTGRRAFHGRSLAELSRKHRDERPIEPSALVAGLDPAVERAILACLEKEPRRRPSSALVVSAMLTGSDPLEAAIAAGETPSPELVAAAGEREGLRPAVAWGLVAFVLAGIMAVPFLAPSFQLLPRLPIEKSPAVLEDRAREFLRGAGLTDAPVDDAWGLVLDYGFINHVREKDSSAGRWDVLAKGTPPVLQFWYRQSPRPIVSWLPGGSVYWVKPGLDVSDMAGVTYDMSGRLLRFYAIPPQLEAEASAPPSTPDWSRLFAEARLDPSALREVSPRWTPLFHSDGRAAWEGAWPERKDLKVRIEAAAYRGRPVWFEVITPWTKPERMGARAWPKAKLVTQLTYLGLTVLLMSAAGFMARRNIVLGRGDRKGAFRVALVLLALGVASWGLGAHHVADTSAEMGLLARGAGLVLLEATLVWLFYLAVEPYARRLRPWTLVSWTRLLGGGLSDPVVGRDTLVGLAWAVGFVLLVPPFRLLAPRLGEAMPEPQMGWVEALQGPGLLLSTLLQLATIAILFSMGLLLLYVLLRLLLRSDVLATAGIAALVVVPSVLGAGDAPWTATVFPVIWAVSWIGLLLRFGLLAAIVGHFANETLESLPLTTDLSSWTAGPTLAAVGLVAILAVASFRTAAGATGLRRALAGEPASRP